MNVALIGYGYWGKIIEKYISSCGLCLKYVYNRSKIVHQNSVDDLEKIWKDDTIELVFICTSISSHYILCKLALENNKHVFCEKPTVKDLGQFQELIKLANDKNKILYTDYIYTVSPSINYIKNICHKIGKLYYIKGEISQFGKFYPEDTVYEVIGVHLISAILYVTNAKIEKVNFRNCVETENILAGNIELKLENNILADIHCNLLDNKKKRILSFYGDRGMIEFNMNSFPNVVVKSYEINGNQVSSQNSNHIEKGFDENNNLVFALKKLKEDIQNNSKKNMEFSEQIMKVLDKIYQ